MTCVVCGTQAPVYDFEILIGVQRESLRKGEKIRKPDIVRAPLYFVAQPGSYKMLHPLCSAACGLRWHEAHA